MERKPVPRPVSLSMKQKLESASDPTERAEIIRNAEIKQLTTRFPSKLKLTMKSDCICINLQLAPSDPDFPFDLEALNIDLNIPKKYPISRNVELLVINNEIPKNIQSNIKNEFEKKSKASSLSLLDLMKWLDNKLEQLLMNKPIENEMRINFFPASSALSTGNVVKQEDYYGEYNLKEAKNVDEKELVGAMKDVSIEKEVSESDESESEHDEIVGDTVDSNKFGTHIRLQNADLGNIALLQCVALNINVKCGRCKTICEFLNVQSSVEERKACIKCSQVLSLKFHHDLVHLESNHLGHLDLNSCTGFDIIACDFLATCGNCNKRQLLKNIQISTNNSSNCRDCHEDIKLFIGSYRFLVVGPVRNEIALKPRKREKNTEAINKGSPLENMGVCKHYKRSFRWFRFPCCKRLYPCDICHEEQKTDGHEMLWANKMVCGFCSKEQPYSQKPCSCGKSLLGNDSVFWNGGKGMRNQRLMNKNDSHKYAGLHKTTSNKKKSK